MALIPILSIRSYRLKQQLPPQLDGARGEESCLFMNFSLSPIKLFSILLPKTFDFGTRTRRFKNDRDPEKAQERTEESGYPPALNQPTSWPFSLEAKGGGLPQAPFNPGPN